jgi:hypothetical protein
MNTSFIILCLALLQLFVPQKKKAYCEGYGYINNDSTNKRKLVEMIYENDKLIYEYKISSLNQVIDNWSRSNYEFSFLAIPDTFRYTYNDDGMLENLQLTNSHMKSITQYLYAPNGILKGEMESTFYLKEYKRGYLPEYTIKTYEHDSLNNIIFSYYHTTIDHSNFLLKQTIKYTYGKTYKHSFDTITTYDVFDKPHSNINGYMYRAYKYDRNYYEIKTYHYTDENDLFTSFIDSFVYNKHCKKYLNTCKMHVNVGIAEYYKYSQKGRLEKSIHNIKNWEGDTGTLTINYKYTE